VAHLTAWLADWSGWFWPAFFHHLWQSTLFAGLVFAAATLLRRGPAHSRYKMWLLASAKFAVPSILFAGPLNRLWNSLSWMFFSPRSSSLNSPNNLANESANVLAQLAVPIHELAEPSVMGHSSALARHTGIYALLTVAWIFGVAVIFAIWWGRRLALSRKVGRATMADSGRAAELLTRARIKLNIARPVKLVLSAEIREPGVWGTWSPVLVLPEAFAAEMTDAELDATILHELVHVMRRDNLVSNLSMTLCCVLWFHPLVWLLDKRLLADREAACDERALGLIEDRGSYLSSILKVSSSGLFSHLAGVSRVNGSDLKRRIEIIMASDMERAQINRDQNSRRDNRMISTPRIIVVASVFAFVLFSAAAGLLNRDSAIAQSAAGRAPSTQDRSKPVQARAGIPGGVAGSVPGGVTGGVPDSVAGGVSDGVAGGVPDGVAGGVPGGVIGGIPGGVPDRVGAIPGQAVDGEQQEHPSEIVVQSPELDQQALEKERILGELVKQAPDTFVPLRFGIGPDLGQSSVTAKILSRETLDQAGLPQPYSAAEYIAQVKIRIPNTSDQPVASLAVMLQTLDSGPKVYAERTNLSIVPGEFYTFTVRCQNGNLLPGGADDLTISLSKDIDTLMLMVNAPNHIHANHSNQGSTSTTVGFPPATEAGGESNSSMLLKSGAELSGSVIQKFLPGYPPLAKAARISGTVVVEVVIGLDGTVESAAALSGHPLLKDAAVATAKRWRWNPTEVSGSPVRVVGVLRFGFTVSDN
jgi:TonB family protein